METIEGKRLFLNCFVIAPIAKRNTSAVSTQTELPCSTHNYSLAFIKVGIGS
jgi:hypothetical protein